MTNSRFTENPQPAAFTLIELLVVISIIALLIAILLPTLKEAKRATVVTDCLARLKSHAIGLTSYATDDPTGHYPLHLHGGPDVIWATGFPAERDAFLTTYLEQVAGSEVGTLWCPFIRHNNPGGIWYPDIPNVTDPEYGLAYLWHRGQDLYWIGYIKPAAMEASWVYWENSGNSGDPIGPAMGPATSDDVILADYIQKWISSPPHFVVDSHADDELNARTHRENSVAYSDGHAEIHAHHYTETVPTWHWNDHHLQIPQNVEWWLY